MTFRFEIHATDGKARRGTLHLPHGRVETPAFMPVGTQGAVKSLTMAHLEEMGAQLILGNTYHLYMRPGHELIRRLGGLHRFIGWDRPMLTDSGGFQVISLAELKKITPEGVTFQSHLDGSRHLFTPRKVMEIELALGADIIMPLDWPAPYPTDRATAELSTQRTTEWFAAAHTYRQTFPEADSTLYAILQGGLYADLRRQSREDLLAFDPPGLAIGGLALGEPKNILFEMLEASLEETPAPKPRYLMGVGKPEDLVEAVWRGVDQFDCVLPTRNARKGTVYTWGGKLLLRSARHKEDARPIDAACGCPVCRRYSRAYIRHLLHAEEISGLIYCTQHSLWFYHRLMEAMREAITAGRFDAWRGEFYARYNVEGESGE